MLQNKKWILVERPTPGETLTNKHFNLVTEEIDSNHQPPENMVLVHVHYLSIDPTQRGWAERDGYMPASPLGEAMRSSGVGQVIKTHSSKFQVGDWVGGMTCIQTYALVNEKALIKLDPQLIETLGGPHNFIPTLNLTSAPTAFVGIEILCSDMEKEGKTLVVSGAAGNVGQWVVQLGKLHYKMKVVGIAGNDEKCRHLVEELGCDAAINYKTENVREALARICPEGVDVYFDNVGGEISEAVYWNMNNFGRVALCGIISSYNSEPWRFPGMGLILVKRLRVQGFIVMDRVDLLPRCFQIVAELVHQKKVKFYTHELKGIENFINGLDALWNGDNIGKVYLTLEH